MKTCVVTNNAPAAIGPYSQAVKAGGFLYISGQLPINPETGEMPLDITGQARQALANVMAIAAQAECAAEDIVKINVYLTDITDFSEVNKVYAEFFTADCPARAAFAVAALPKAASIEIEAVAYCGLQHE